MSLPILTINDFTGVYDLSINSIQEQTLISQIEFYEDKFIRFFFSDEFYKMKSEQTDSNDAIDFLINGTEWTDEDGNIFILDGFKQILLRLIYREFFTNEFFGQTTLLEIENSRLNSSSNLSNKLNNIYTDAINVYTNQIIPFWNFSKDLTGYESYLNFNLPILRVATFI